MRSPDGKYIRSVVWRPLGMSPQELRDGIRLLGGRAFVDLFGRVIEEVPCEQP